MSNADIYKALMGSMNTYNGGIFGPSFLDQYRNANLGLDKLGTLGFKAEESAPWKSVLQGQKGAAAMGMATSVLNGAVDIGNNMADLMTLQDTSWLDNNLEDIRNISRGPINSMEDVVSMQNRINSIDTDISIKDIRGKSKAERFGTIGTSALSGAGAGMAFGPVGAFVGAAIGGVGAGLADVFAQQDARDTQRGKQINAQLAYRDADRNIQAGIEQNNDYQFRNAVPTRKAMGGPVKTQTLQEFADKVMKRRTDSRTRPSGIVKERCKGGIVIRFKD